MTELLRPPVMTDSQRQTLEVVAKSRTAAHREVLRAWVLLAARGRCCQQRQRFSPRVNRLTQTQTTEGEQHPNRDGQFAHINSMWGATARAVAR